MLLHFKHNFTSDSFFYAYYTRLLLEFPEIVKIKFSFF